MSKEQQKPKPPLKIRHYAMLDAVAIEGIFFSGDYFRNLAASRTADETSLFLAKNPNKILSNRQREIMVLFASGLSQKEIGARLKIDQKTVSDHLTRIKKKLRISANADIIKYSFCHQIKIEAANGH